MEPATKNAPPTFATSGVPELSPRRHTRVPVMAAKQVGMADDQTQIETLAAFVNEARRTLTNCSPKPD